jgi:hypothetical protein
VSGGRFTAKHTFCWTQLPLVDRCHAGRLQSVEASGTLHTQRCIWLTRDVAGCIQSPVAPHSHVVHRMPGTVRQPSSNHGIRCRVGLSEVNGVRVPQLSHVSQTGLDSHVRYLMNQISALQSWVFCSRDLCCSMRSTTASLLILQRTGLGDMTDAGRTDATRKMNVTKEITENLEADIALRLQ